MALVELIQRSINPIKSIAGKITNIQRAFAGVTRMEEFLDDLNLKSISELPELPEVDEGPNDQVLSEVI